MGVLTPSPFQLCVNFVLKDEGVFSDSNVDPGGMTVFGIARTFHRDKEAFWARVDELLEAGGELATDQTLLDMAIAIYRAEYWMPLEADMLPVPVALVAFDCAVNQGVSRAKVWLQYAFGLRQDGVFGPVTKSAFVKLAAPSADPVAVQEAVAVFQGARLAHYASIQKSNPKNYAEHHKGWFRRSARMSWRAALLSPRGF